MREKPTAPYFVTYIGYISKLSSSSSTYDGQIYVDIRIIPISSDIPYDNSGSGLESQTVKGALDELSQSLPDIEIDAEPLTLVQRDANGRIRASAGVANNDALM